MENDKTSLMGALIQMTSGEDVSENVRQCLEIAEQALNQNEKLQLLIYPENALYFRVGPKKEAIELDDDRLTPLSDFVKERGIHLIVGGSPVDEGGETYNSMIYWAPGEGPRVIYRKIHLFDVDVEGQKPIRESDQFESGSCDEVLEVEGWKLGLSICYDLRFPELYLKYAKQEVDAILVPAAFLVPTGKAHWHTLLRARAIECQCYVLAPAQAGEHVSGEYRRQTFGHSLVVEPWGEISAEAMDDKPQIVLFDLDSGLISKARRQIPMAQHRRL